MVTGPAYPTAVDSASCVSASTTIYCIGGDEDGGETVLNDVYYSQVSSTTSTPGSWTTGATYPQAAYATSCVTYDGDIYCVGVSIPTVTTSATRLCGDRSGRDRVWNSTTAYPKLADSLACVVVSGGYIYCVAGRSKRPPPAHTNYTMRS